MTLAQRLALFRFWAAERAGGLGILGVALVIGVIGLTIVPLGPDRRLEGRVAALEGDPASFAVVRLAEGGTVRAPLPENHGCRTGDRLVVLKAASLVPRMVADPRGCHGGPIPPERETP